MSEAKRLSSWFDEAARRHPQAIALVAGGRQLSYQELSARVDEAAGQLDGVLPAGARVGLIARRDPDSYVAYLAVLRSSRSVVPLNPSFPRRRTEQMLDQAEVAALVGPDDAIGELTSSWRNRLRLPGTDAYLSRRAPLADLGTDLGADSIAYILFTSGTTGTPKGIPITHANVSALLNQVTTLREITEGERVSQCFDLTFDPSVADMFCAWKAGATLVVPTHEQLRDPVSFINELGVSHWASVPSVISLAARMRQLGPGTLPGLRSSLFAGEPLTLTQARAWRAAAPHSQIWNAYGPTEMTIFCTAYLLSSRAEDWPETSNGTVPIGRPFPGVRWRVAAPSAPANQRGELWLGGAQRFNGYLDESHNGTVFVAATPTPTEGRSAPGAPTAPATFYRSGDNVAETPDGLLHLGRIDKQVQVNGYRVELSEVEGALRSHPGVDEAVAILVAGELVAIYTGDAVDAGAILDTVAGRLPPYMVPGRLRHQPTLPLNGNGKVDRAAVVALLRADAQEGAA